MRFSENGVDGNQIQDLNLIAIKPCFSPEQKGSKNGNGNQIENQVSQGGIHIFSSDC